MSLTISIGEFIRPRSIAGNLMTYGPDLDDAWRNAATYVDKILKGSKRADVPVQLSTKYELVINLKTAKSLSLKYVAKDAAVAETLIACPREH